MLTETDRILLAELDWIQREFVKLREAVFTSTTAQQDEKLIAFENMVKERKQAVADRAARRQSPFYGQPDWRYE